MSDSDVETYKAARPFVRGVLAFIIRLRTPAWTIEQCFDSAEAWLKEFEGRG